MNAQRSLDLFVLCVSLFAAFPASGIGSFTYTQWGSLAPASSWTIAAGEFTGDSLDDVFAYDSATGNLWIAESTGTSFTMSASPWFTVAPASDAAE